MNLSLQTPPNIPVVAVEEFSRFRQQVLDWYKTQSISPELIERVGNGLERSPHRVFDRVGSLSQFEKREREAYEYGRFRYIDQYVISECVIRAGKLRSGQKLRVLELGGGPTVPTFEEIGAPHLARALAEVDPAKFDVHMVEQGRFEEDCLPEIENELFGLQVHTSGWDSLKFIVEQNSFDVVFSRFLFPPVNVREAESVAAIARTMRSPQGAILLNFDVNLSRAPGIEKYILFKEGRVFSDSSEMNGVLNAARYTTSGKFKLADNWLEFAPPAIRKAVESRLDALLTETFNLDSARPVYPPRAVQSQVGASLNLSSFHISSSFERVLQPEKWSPF